MSNSSPMLVFVLGVMFAGLCFGVTSLALNVMIDSINIQTDAGMRSEDSYDFLNFVFEIWRFAPLAVLIGVCIYTYEVSKGSAIDATVFFEYLAMFYATSLLAIVLMWGWGLVIDTIFDSFIAQPSIANVDPVWDRTGVVSTITKFVYYMLATVDIIAMLLMMFFPIIAQRNNTMFEVDEEEGNNNNSGGGALVFNPKQF